MIGRVKAAIVFDAVGIISEILVRTCSDGDERLVYRGPSNFDEKSKKHLSFVVLPVVDRITEGLKAPRRNFEISVVNLSATASAGIGVKITGFSADLPILVALISTSLQMPLKQDIVSTGHVASVDGDLVCVRGIPAKLEAAIASSEISEFVVADIDRERSPQKLTPLEYKAAKESIYRYEDKIKIHTVGNILDAFKVYFTDEAIVFGSLKSDFFYKETAKSEPQSFTGRILDFFAWNNKKKFWDVLEFSFLNRDLEKVRALLLTYIESHIRTKHYPVNFGEELFRLIVSLPPAIRKIDDLFPLFPMELCIQLTQSSTKNDHDDVRTLYKTVFGEGLGGVFLPGKTSETIPSPEKDKEGNIIDWLLNELNQENLSKKVGQSLDHARASYVMDKISVKDGFEFNEVITAFYSHMYRHCDLHAAHMDKKALSAEAIDLVTKAFSRKGEYNAALSEGKHATNGGLRMVFDAMTDYMKIESREKYITRIFKDTIDSLNWDDKVNLMEAFMKRIKFELPDDLKDLPAKQLAPHWESIIQYYAESRSKMADLLKKL